MYRMLVTAFLTWLHSYAFQWILGIFYSKWSQNPFVRGSYANAEVGTTAADFHNLGGKLGKLYLTGDAVDPDWWGFAQGSYFSGEKKAKEILQCMKNNCELFWPKANVVQEVYTNPWRCSSIQMMNRPLFYQIFEWLFYQCILYDWTHWIWLFSVCVRVL